MRKSNLIRNNYQSESLPVGWILTKLGKIITLEYGKGLTKEKRDAKGRVPVYGSNGIVGYHTRALTTSACIVVGRKGAAGMVHLSNTPCWPIDTTYYVSPRSGLNLHFLYYLLSTLNLKSFDRSTAIPGLNRDDAYILNVPIPPLNEQNRIVAKLEELFTGLDTGIEYLKKMNILLKQYRQSVLKYAFEGKLTEKWRRDNKIPPKSFTGTDLNKIDQMYIDLPKEWELKEIGDFVNIIDYRGRTPPYMESGIVHIRSSNIRKGKILWEDLRYVSKDTYEKYMTRGIPKKGDLLFTTEGPLGEVSLIPEVKFSLAQRIMILRPSKYIDPKFLMYQIMSERFQHILYNKGTGSTIKGISSRNFRPLKICIPALEEQLMIVEEIEKNFSIIDNAERIMNTNLNYSTKLRQTILKKAFAGKLVPQDPNDEHAEVLLEKIKEEKPITENKNNSKISKNKSDSRQMRLV